MPSLRRINRLCLCFGLVALVTGTACAQPWPAPIRAIEDQGVTIVKQFEAPGGMTGFAARAGTRPVALYLTPDGQHVIVGTLLDAEGKNLTKPQLDAAITEPSRVHAWAQLEDADWIADGADDAPRVVYVFTDPNCGFCHKFYKLSRPWVAAGKVQLRHVPVGILRASSTAKAATWLAADDPSRALRAHEANYRSGGTEQREDIPDKFTQAVAHNNRLMSQLGLNGTPGIVYRKNDGKTAFKQGVPTGALVTTILGPK